VCEFNKRNNSKDTLQSWCKICLTEYRKKYYRDNFENSKNYHKKYYEKNIDKYFKGFTEQLNYIIQYTNLDPKYFKLTGPNLNWSDYFESEPTSCPDLCTGAGYKIEYKPPTN